ncbi:Uncharacterised protein, partial [Mycoplasmoides gallisepticum]
MPEETQPEQVQEKVQAYEHVEEQQPEEVFADAIDEHYDEITHVEDKAVEEEQIQTDNVVSSDEINW